MKKTGSNKRVWRVGLNLVGFSQVNVTEGFKHTFEEVTMAAVWNICPEQYGEFFKKLKVAFLYYTTFLFLGLLYPKWKNHGEDSSSLLEHSN